MTASADKTPAHEGRWLVVAVVVVPALIIAAFVAVSVTLTLREERLGQASRAAASAAYSAKAAAYQANADEATCEQERAWIRDQFAKIGFVDSKRLADTHLRLKMENPRWSGNC